MRNPFISLANDSHCNNPVVRQRFEKDFGLIAKVKTINGAAWSASRGFWYIAKSDFKLNSVFEALKDVAWVDYFALKSNTLNEVSKTQKQKPDSKPQITSSKTTEIYTHIANTDLAKIKSPLDRFFEDNVIDTNMLQK